MVAPDRTRRARHRPQRGEPAPAPADGEGAELPRRRASCRARAFLDVALDRARPPCEEARAGSLPRLRARRTRVGACRTRAARAPSSRGGEGRAARRGLCEEGQRPAHRGRQAPALNTLQLVAPQDAWVSKARPCAGSGCHAAASYSLMRPPSSSCLQMCRAKRQRPVVGSSC